MFDCPGFGFHCHAGGEQDVNFWGTPERAWLRNSATGTFGGGEMHRLSMSNDASSCALQVYLYGLLVTSHWDQVLDELQPEDGLIKYWQAYASGGFVSALRGPDMALSGGVTTLQDPFWMQRADDQLYGVTVPIRWKAVQGVIVPMAGGDRTSFPSAPKVKPFLVGSAMTRSSVRWGCFSLGRRQL